MMMMRFDQIFSLSLSLSRPNEKSHTRKREIDRLEGCVAARRRDRKVVSPYDAVVMTT